VGESASVEAAVSAAASIALRTLSDNRSVAITLSSRRLQIVQPDRGTRVEQKILHLLANVQADGNRPLAEILLGTLPQLRRGMTLCIVTGSTDREWVRALAALRRRGVGTIVVLVDRASFVAREDDESRAELAAVRHILAEYDVQHHLVRAGDDLGQVIGSRVRIGAERVRLDG
jgi:phosphatidylserine/phosphatidylglycerophosphate/cardiolipin synthase-like enzyme